MAEVSRLLAPTGVAVLRIPTASSFAWEKFRTDWVQLDAPRHFFIRSVESMEKLLELSELELYKVVYDSTAFEF